MRVRHELPRNWWFLPNDDFIVSWCIGSRVDLVSSWRNQVYDFYSLSSLITLPCQHFAYVTNHLTRIETIINAPLELPSVTSSSGGKKEVPELPTCQQALMAVAVGGQGYPRRRWFTGWLALKLILVIYYIVLAFWNRARAVYTTRGDPWKIH